MSAEPVITMRRASNSNLRTQLIRIIRRAGLEPWPRLFQNLRATRETELAQQFPMHVVCEWIGNSQLVAVKHYLQVTDADYQRATTHTASTDDESALQNPVQQAPKIGRNESQPGLTNIATMLESPGSSSESD